MVIIKKSSMKKNLARGKENIVVYSDMLYYSPHLFSP